MHEIGRVVWKRKETAKCIDGVERTAFIRSYWDGHEFAIYGDTYFSAPAFVRVNGRQVRGYVVAEDDCYLFHANREGKNAALIVKARGE